MCCGLKKILCFFGFHKWEEKITLSRMYRLSRHKKYRKYLKQCERCCKIEETGERYFGPTTKGCGDIKNCNV